jgi:hypothetical protein
VIELDDVLCIFERSMGFSAGAFLTSSTSSARFKGGAALETSLIGSCDCDCDCLDSFGPMIDVWYWVYEYIYEYEGKKKRDLTRQQREGQNELWKPFTSLL